MKGANDEEKSEDPKEDGMKVETGSETTNSKGTKDEDELIKSIFLQLRNNMNPIAPMRRQINVMNKAMEATSTSNAIVINSLVKRMDKVEAILRSLKTRERAHSQGEKKMKREYRCA